MERPPKLHSLSFYRAQSLFRTAPRSICFCYHSQGSTDRFCSFPSVLTYTIRILSWRLGMRIRKMKAKISGKSSISGWAPTVHTALPCGTHFCVCRAVWGQRAQWLCRWIIPVLSKNIDGMQPLWIKHSISVICTERIDQIKPLNWTISKPSDKNKIQFNHFVDLNLKCIIFYF